MARTLEHALVVPLSLALLAGAAVVCSNCYQTTRTTIVQEIERLDARSGHDHLYNPCDETGTVVVDAKGLLQLCGSIRESLQLLPDLPSGDGGGSGTGPADD